MDRPLARTLLVGYLCLMTLILVFAAAAVAGNGKIAVSLLFALAATVTGVIAWGLMGLRRWAWWGALVGNFLGLILPLLYWPVEASDASSVVGFVLVGSLLMRTKPLVRGQATVSSLAT